MNAGAYHYYSGMGPGLLSGIYRPQETRFNVKKLAEERGATFIQETVDTVQAPRGILVLGSKSTIAFDVASFNTGSSIAAESIDASYDNILAVKPIENFYHTRRRICELAKARHGLSLAFVVVGGGAAGVETACNLWRAVQDIDARGAITLISSGPILKRYGQEARRKALQSMRGRGMAVIEGAKVCGNTGDRVYLADGGEIPFDFALLATGARPSRLFAHSGIPTGEDGGMLVNQHLQSVRYPNLFGGGDCISFGPRPLDKVGVYAVRENPILADNLEAAIRGGELRAFCPQESYLQLLNMGDGTALYNKKALLSGTRYAFRLKNRIDRAFMRQFQLTGELQEADE